MMKQEELKGRNICHYTDFIAMRGILVDGEMRLNSLKRMNDKKEMDYFVEKLQYTVKKKSFEQYGDYVDRLFEKQLKNRNNWISYAACFSEAEDDAAQWERYGKGGQGVCIVFDAELLKIITKGLVRLTQVHYRHDVVSHEHVKLLTSIVNDPEHTIPEGWSSMEGIFSNIWACSPIFKHPSFKSEKEYRLVTLPFCVEHYLGKPQYMISSCDIKEFYIVNLRELCKKSKVMFSDLIKRIYIGSKSNVTIHVMKNFFENEGIDELKDKIQYSECPLQ